jgi:DNA invertase Pin-like site-specific DNA recombinase
MPRINTGDRKELGKLLQSIAAGDQVLATRIDRLARSMSSFSPSSKKSSTRETILNP